MPYAFGRKSLQRLQTAHPLWRDVAQVAIAETPMDFTVVWAFRGEEDQNAAFASGASTKRYPDSKHNYTATEQDIDEGYASRIGQPLSLAVDFMPWFRLTPHIRWDWPEEARWLNGFIVGVGTPIVRPHGFIIRTGADWDMDGDHHDQRLIDLPHLELRRLDNA